MEPKPRGIHPENSIFSSLPWLKKASEEYQPITGSSYTETSFFRGNSSIEVLDTILPEIPHRPNILLVGLGLDADPLLCPYEPYKIAAHLEGKKIDYTMTLVDIDEKVIDDVRNREKLFLAYKQFEGKLAVSFEREWNAYLSSTHQQGELLYEQEEGMNFLSYYEAENAMVPFTSYLTDGIAAAYIPRSFRSKLITGEISLLNADIALAHIADTGPYDYADITNVLYQMSEHGQELALANIAWSLRPHGRLLVNDIGGYVGTPVFSRLGGWLDDERVGQLGLSVEKIISSKDTSQLVLFRKNDETSYQ